MATDTANRKNPLGRTKSQQPSWGRRKTDKSSPASSRQRSFLNHVFESLPIFEITPLVVNNVGIRNEDGEPRLILSSHSIPIAPNVEKMLRSAIAYCKAHGKPELTISATDPLMKLHEIYSHLLKYQTENRKIGIDYDVANNELHFLEYVKSEYPSCTLAFLTVAILDNLADPHRQFFLEFFSLMKATMEMPFPHQHFDFSYPLGIFDEDIMEDMRREDEGYSDMLDSYNGGHIRELFDEIQRTPWHPLMIGKEANKERFDSLIRTASSPELADLIEIAIEGIGVMGNECISSYRGNINYCEIPEFFNEYDDEEYLNFERIVAVCYGNEDEDPIVESTIEILNNDGSNYEQEELYEVCEISEKYTAPFNGTQFPAKWFEWFARYNQTLWKYESTLTNVQ